MIPGGGRVARQVEDVGKIDAGIEGKRAEVPDGRDHNDAVQVDAVAALQQIGESGVTEGAVTFTDKEFRGVPTIVAGDVGLHELCQGTGVLIDAPKVLVLSLADGFAETGADGIDENEVGAIEQTVGIVFESVGRGRSDVRIHGDHALRTEGAHVQPDGRGTGAAVVEKGERTLAEILDVAARVRGVVDEGFVLVLFILEENCAGRGLVRDGLTADFDGVLGDGGFFLGRWRRGGFGGFFSGLGFFFLCGDNRNGKREKQSGAKRVHPEFGIHSRFSPWRFTYDAF